MNGYIGEHSRAAIRNFDVVEMPGYSSAADFAYKIVWGNCVGKSDRYHSNAATSKFVAVYRN